MGTCLLPASLCSGPCGYGVSERVSLAYWGDVLPASYKKMEHLIKDIRITTGEGGKETYVDLRRFL